MSRRSPSLAILFLAATPTLAADPPDPKRFDDTIRPLLAKHCVSCHGAEKPKGQFRVETLTADFSTVANRERWREAAKRVRAGEMPPKTPLPKAEAAAFADWAERSVDHAIITARAATGRVPLRRLNRIEYENTIRDLLGVTIELREMLPLDSSANGFDTVSDAQHVSSFLMERYLDAADVALNAAIANSPKPPPVVSKRLSLKDERHVKVTTEKVFRPLDDALVMFSSSAWQSITVSQFYPPDRGLYRFRISTFATQSGEKPITYRVDAGPMLMGTKNHHVGYFDAKPGTPGAIEFTDHLEARSTIRLLPYGLASAQSVDKIGADKFEGPGLAVQWVEVEGPIHETWPPESHRRLFGDLPHGPAPVYNNRARVEVVSKSPEADAERILRNFARRAFRRPITDDDLRPFLAIASARLAAGSSFEQAVRAAMKGVLVSPGFLYLREPAGPLDDHALASRLSYFLWSSMPDDELTKLADTGKLREPAVLRGQVERLLKNPKAQAFTENFVGQWLGLRDLDFTEPSHILYPEYDHLLRVSMEKETLLFFDEVLRNDSSLTHFVASDFSMLNGRLARHYGIQGIDGGEFRKVSLPKDAHRGGLLTMASVLKVTANGTSTSPVIRGAWVLDRILGTPPPKPPPDVPAVEPDIRGATTIREQLAKHRQLESCAGCHRLIDPPGFALESFDVIGGYRENYRTTGQGKSVTVDGRRMAYHEGRKVDPSDALLDGSKFANIDELKQLLLRDKDQLTRSLTVKLLTYATGAAPDLTDRAEVEAIVAKAPGKEYGFRSLIHEVVASALFTRK